MTYCPVSKRYAEFPKSGAYQTVTDPIRTCWWVPLGKTYEVPELSAMREEVTQIQMDARIEEQNKLLAEIEAQRTEDYRKTLTITLDDGREMRIDITIIGKAGHQIEVIDPNPTDSAD